MVEEHIIARIVKKSEDRTEQLNCFDKERGDFMRIYGITGNIATGKSTVSNYLLKKGYPLIDSDRLSHEALTIDETCIKQTLALFDCEEKGKIDRKKLGEIVFHNKSAKQQLEAIIHPYVKRRIDELLESYQDQEIVFIDVPLLYELKWQSYFDQVIVVACDEDIQLKRLMKRNGYSKDYSLTIMNNQMPLKEKVNNADVVFKNNGDLNALYHQIDIWLKRS